MNQCQPVMSIAQAMTRAMDADLPDLEWEGRNGETKTRRPHEDDILVIQFPQQWGSTALGFGGIGGAAMTTADTTVILSGASAAVYFAGRKAYVVKRFNQAFMDDVGNQAMVDVGKHGKYER